MSVLEGFIASVAAQAATLVVLLLFWSAVDKRLGDIEKKVDEQAEHNGLTPVSLGSARMRPALASDADRRAAPSARQSPLHGAEKTNRPHSERPSRSLRRAAEGVAGMSTS